jgi:hypothetical protein
VLAADVARLNGTHLQELLTAEAERVIHLHAAASTSSAAAVPAPLYVYLAHHNVHGAVNLPEYALQAPEATVGLYNTTVNDTFKVAGAMLTELDYGVGRLVEVLKETGLYNNSVITFACDNGGPLDHSTNSPLRGGKHTMWEGGLRASAWVHSPLLPPAARGAQWEGLMHASDWLPTFVEGSSLPPRRHSHGPKAAPSLHSCPNPTSPPPLMDGRAAMLVRGLTEHTKKECFRRQCPHHDRYLLHSEPRYKRTPGLAGLNATAVATGPRPLDGFNMCVPVPEYSNTWRSFLVD